MVRAATAENSDNLVASAKSLDSGAMMSAGAPWARSALSRPPAESDSGSAKWATDDGRSPALVRMPTVSIAPASAAPSAEPTCRMVDWVAEACPDSDSGMSPSTSDVSCAEARPRPRP